MDTRSKILGESQAAEMAGQLGSAGVAIHVVTGYFDVLVASHLRALREIADAESKLIALVLDPPSPLLPLAARAELAAAIRMIDYVVTVPSDPDELLRRLRPARICRFEADDARRALNLIEHVQKRSQA